jgi:hypothetical protein
VTFIDWWTEVVAQRTGIGGGVEGDHQWDTRREQHRHGALPMRALSGGKKEKRERMGWGSLGKEACERHTSEKRNEREGGSGTGTRVKIESRQVCRGKRGVWRKGEGSAAPCCGHARAARMGPATDGVRRSCTDSDPASVDWSPGTGATSHRWSKHFRLQAS